MRSYFVKNNYTSFLNTLNMISRNTWRKKVQHYHHNKHKASLIKFCSLLSSCTQIGFSIVIWSHRTCWLARTDKLSSLLISVWPVPSACQSRHTRTRSWPYGTDALRSCCPKSTTHSVSTSGPQAASSQRWLRRDRCSQVTARLTRSSKYSKCLAHRTRITGPMQSNYQILRHLSQGSKASRCRTTRQRWTS